MTMDQKQLEKAKTAKSVRELSIMAHKEGVTLSDPQAERLFAELHPGDRELSDSELNNVTGGCGETEAERQKKYLRVKANGYCDRHEWTNWAYTGIGSFVALGDRHCSNCHYSESVASGTGYYCTVIHP